MTPVKGLFCGVPERISDCNGKLISSRTHLALRRRCRLLLLLLRCRQIQFPPNIIFETFHVDSLRFLHVVDELGPDAPELSLRCNE